MYTTGAEMLRRHGVYFAPLGEAVRHHPELVRRYLGSVVPRGDNYYAALNAAVFGDGTFVYVPPGVQCPIPLSTYFRINRTRGGQFERTLIVVDRNASATYVEACSAPPPPPPPPRWSPLALLPGSQRRGGGKTLHAAVVEVVAEENADVRYATVQMWDPLGVLNYVTKRAVVRARARMQWVQVEAGAAATWKYPSCRLAGRGAEGEFHSVAATGGRQAADTGTRMVHAAEGTRSAVVAKSIAAGDSRTTYRGIVAMRPGAAGAVSHTQCDTLIVGTHADAATLPVVEAGDPTARATHEATTARLDAEALLYARSRGLDEGDAARMVVRGFCGDVLGLLPLEFAAEARELLATSMAGAVA